ncbi:hypothetical protein DDZ13_11060 [Coraliomargarita sinensis]|uniref:Ice-binding protein C-terminal domain-containing protein n=1 Tax=Coraliomargarita sinensis TaxID=2174842 RepID=A0A317ZE14_9BACT|nr:PEP-CTERM sorting domain-containing protein [Coraliomargarita sinensis]PXA03516.1 hypothetical protein DDZ13_11060 [Coraliomargarita sinensis]
MKNPILFSALAISLATSAATAQTVILADDFTGVSKTNNVATITSWNTEVGFNAGTSFTAFNDGGGAANYHDVQADKLDPDASVFGGGTDGWYIDFSLALDASTSAIDLTSLSLTSYAITGGGALRNKQGTIDWELTISGDNGYTQTSAIGTSSDFGGGQTATTTIDLSTFADLVAGENYSARLFVTKTQAGGDDTHMSLGDFSMSGNVTAVPEPSSFGLLSGMLAIGWIMARRRQ